MSIEKEVNEYNPNNNNSNIYNNSTQKYVSEAELYELAKRRIKLKQEFFTHLGAYCVVNGGILLLSLFLFHTMMIFLLSTVGWGIGLGCHYIDTVSKLKLDTKNTKLIEQEVEFLKKKMQ
ncbi:2TM domain-containing protein [Clostridium thermarum]|uniref:2TM domain-containing protein n=1 Tax=Clostridium thermarum TaxID=1716543 RepID=UPI00111E43AF|nr:2TM domain-containing protein [Clostridium thermarum]